jgi:hypothetical protein
MSLPVVLRPEAGTDVPAHLTPVAAAATRDFLFVLFSPAR